MYIQWIWATHNRWYCQSHNLCCLHTHTCSPQLCFIHISIYHRYDIAKLILCGNMHWASLYYLLSAVQQLYTHILNHWCFWTNSKGPSWTQFDRSGLCGNFSIFCCKHKRLFNLRKQQLSNLLHSELWLNCCGFICVHCCISDSKYVQLYSDKPCLKRDTSFNQDGYIYVCKGCKNRLRNEGTPLIRIRMHGPSYVEKCTKLPSPPSPKVRPSPLISSFNDICNRTESITRAIIQLMWFH